MPRKRLGMLLVLVLSAATRLAWFATHDPDVPPDAFSYLNVARQLRGIPQPDEWDPKSFLPANNQATRTPGYPLFLNLVFLAAGHSPSPPGLIERVGRQHVPPGPRHMERLSTDENARAVHIAQMALGLTATELVYVMLLAWTGRQILASAGSLVAVGLNPVWIVMFEPAVITEALAATLLVASVWIMDVADGPSEAGPSARSTWEMLVSLICGFNVLVRPAMVFATLPILAFLLCRRRWNSRAAVRIVVPFAAPIAALIIWNGVAYGYWGVSSAMPPTLFSHFVDHPEAVSEPVAHRLRRYRGNVSAGLIIQNDLTAEEGYSYLAAVNLIQSTTTAAIASHPLVYLQSVAGATAEFWAPTIRLFPYEINVLRTHAPWAWRGIVALEALLVYSSVGVFFLRVPAPAKVAAAVYIACSLGSALTAHTENRRFAMPVEPLAMMAGIAAIAQIQPRHLYTRIAAYS